MILVNVSRQETSVTSVCRRFTFQSFVQYCKGVMSDTYVLLRRINSSWEHRSIPAMLETNVVDHMTCVRELSDANGTEAIPVSSMLSALIVGGREETFITFVWDIFRKRNLPRTLRVETSLVSVWSRTSTCRPGQSWSGLRSADTRRTLDRTRVSSRGHVLNGTKLSNAAFDKSTSRSTDRGSRAHQG